jgi:transketolase
MVASVQSGHPGGSLGCVEYFASLYFDIMDINPPHFDMDGIGEDVFFLSNGHISPVWYSVLSRRGYFPIKELATFRKLNSRLQGHPATKEHLEGIRVASGSLGQGLSVALGTAMAKKLNGDKKLVYSLHGDGELQEGQIWEAAMYASANKIDNIISTIDYNGKQIDGPVEDVLSLGDLKAKWEAFGWMVIEEPNGNNLDAIRQTLRHANNTSIQTNEIILFKTMFLTPVGFLDGLRIIKQKIYAIR